MSPEEFNREPNAPHTGVMGEPPVASYRKTAPNVTANVPASGAISHSTGNASFETQPRDPIYTIRPSWELFWGALVAVVAAVALAVGALSDGDLRNWSVVGGVILVAAIRGLVGWVLQTMTTPKD